MDEERHILIHIGKRTSAYVAIDQQDLNASADHGTNWLSRHKKGYGATPWEAVLDLAQKKVTRSRGFRP